MERLTDDNFKLGFDDSNKLPSYESIYERLIYYESLAEQGKLMILPCKPGDTVYICKSIVSFGEIGDKSKVNYMIDKAKFEYWMIPYIGKTVFLTEPEAQEALERIKHEKA